MVESTNQVGVFMKAKKPKHEVDLDEEPDFDLSDTLHAKFMEEVSEILGQAYTEINNRARALVDELEAK